MKTKSTLTGLSLLLMLTFATTLSTFSQEKEKSKGPPAWAPAHGYRANTRHIFFPDQNLYFDLQRNVYIYLSAGNWQVSVKLPSLYAGIDLKGATKVELELDTDTPQKYNSEHILKFKTKQKGGEVKSKTVEPDKGKAKKK